VQQIYHETEYNNSVLTSKQQAAISKQQSASSKQQSRLSRDCCSLFIFEFYPILLFLI
jgi:hypothetical protein